MEWTAKSMGEKGGSVRGPSKARTTQLKSWWQSAGPAERKARLLAMANGRKIKRAESKALAQLQSVESR